MPLDLGRGIRDVEHPFAPYTVQDIYPPPASLQSRARVSSIKAYEELYQRAANDPEAFWAEQAERLDWIERPTKIRDASFAQSDVHIRWFEDGRLNLCSNAIDRHLETKADQTALIFEPNDPDEETQFISYQQLHGEVCRLANALRAEGVKKGDRVTIYLPMIPEAVYSMLACARIGAVHSVVFGGFSPEALAGRINDAASEVLITADEGRRGLTHVPLKQYADEAAAKCEVLRRVIVVKHTGGEVGWDDDRDRWLYDLTGVQPDDCPAESMNAEDPLYILYTSGSTGAPKGLVHTTGGYGVYASFTHELVFDYQEGDVYWCAADVGWVTGHSYIVYGPLLNGASQIIYEGLPTFPDAGRWWEIVDKHQVTQFYTAPTAIRALMAAGDDFVTRSKRSSLRILGSVGEPINPEAWRWYHRVVGDGRCPIVDTWWQTETGGIMISPLPGATGLKPGSATRPLPGILPVLLSPEGDRLEGPAEGLLAIEQSWPGQARTVYGDHERFVQTYFSTLPGFYFTGDGARRDEDGYYWITGRVDDVLNISGHRLGTAEIESALVLHPDVAEAAIVGIPHHLKGQTIYAYVTLVSGAVDGPELRHALKQQVRRQIGPIADPEFIQFTNALPKTRSGKIMRRILRKVAAGDHDQLGDTSTLADPEVVERLVQGCLTTGQEPR